VSVVNEEVINTLDKIMKRAGAEVYEYTCTNCEMVSRELGYDSTCPECNWDEFTAETVIDDQEKYDLARALIGVLTECDKRLEVRLADATDGDTAMAAFAGHISRTVKQVMKEGTR